MLCYLILYSHITGSICTVSSIWNSVTVLTQVGHPGKARVKADLLDFVCASHEEVNDPVSHNTVGEALDDVMKSSPHV